MKFMKRTESIRATLHIGHDDVRLFWSQGANSGSAVVLSREDDSSPLAILRAAAQVLRSCVVDNRPKVSLGGCRWRLVLPGGFYAKASKPTGRWSSDLAQAAATELEALCPVPLDELHTSAIPISEANAWVCGFPKTILSQWQDAFNELGFALEGVWTEAAAIVDWTLEQGPQVGLGLSYWQSGRVRIEISSAQETADSIQVSPSIKNIRVFAHREAAASQGMVLEQASENPIAHWPGWLTHQLIQIDPSESLNLLHGEHKSVALERSSQRQFTSVMVIWAASFFLLGAANFASIHASHQEASAAQLQIASLWHQTQGSTTLAPLPVTTLEQQAANWRSVRSTLSGLSNTRPSIADTWATLIKNLPPPLKITLSSMRTRGTELWLEGQVPSQADARQLETAWHDLPHLKSDPMRLSAATGGTVSFSVRMVMQ